MKKLILSSLLSFIFLVGFTQKADDIVGKWYTEDNKSIVFVYKSGKKYFGKITWLKDPDDSSGKPKKDKKNPDSSKRNQTLKGLVFLKNFEFDEDDEWEDGKIYNPEDGKTYSGYMYLKDKNTLGLRGYVGMSMFGKTSTWKRVNKK